MLGGAKGSAGEAVLAWWLRRRTVAGRAWIAQRLAMGHPTRVTWAVGRVRRAARGELARWRDRLEKRGRG